MPIPNQGACQSRKTAKNAVTNDQLAVFPNQELAPNPKHRLGTFATFGASNARCISRRSWSNAGQACRGVVRQEGRRTERRCERSSPRLWGRGASEAQRPRTRRGGARWLGVQEMAQQSPIERLLSFRFFARVLTRRFEIRFDLPF